MNLKTHSQSPPPQTPFQNGAYYGPLEIELLKRQIKLETRQEVLLEHQGKQDRKIAALEREAVKARNLEHRLAFIEKAYWGLMSGAGVLMVGMVVLILKLLGVPV